MAKVDVALLREQLGEPGKPLSQTEFAKLVGVNQATVCRWEKRKGKGPTRLQRFLLKELETKQSRA